MSTAAYQTRLDELGMAGKSLAVAIVHHANYKINKLKEKHLQNEGIVLPMPWLLSEFGNVSAASNMIAFLRELPNLKPFDHILIDGFGAGTYYDALAVELGGSWTLRVHLNPGCLFLRPVIFGDRVKLFVTNL